MEPIVASANGKTFNVWTNPSFSGLVEISPLVRFMADNKTQNVYIWDFSSGHHSDVSIGFKLDDLFNSLEFLKGHAESKSGRCVNFIPECYSII